LKKEGTTSKILLIFFILIQIIFNSLCKKESPKETTKETALISTAEIDAKKIGNLVGIPFKILKTETIGYIPLHKFYWISIREKVKHQGVEKLADAIIKETIAIRPNAFHSFTIHFFWEDDLADTLEKSKCFARATFLPEGGWLKVGRVPIDEYKNYELNCIHLE